MPRVRPAAPLLNGGSLEIHGHSLGVLVQEGSAPVDLPREVEDPDSNALRLDIEEGARLAGLDCIVNAVGTSVGETAGVFVGDLVKAHRAAVDLARKIYLTDAPLDADIGIFNAFPEDTKLLQALKALNVWTGNITRRLVRPGGTVVIVTASSEGLGFHSLADRGMRLYRKVDHKQEMKDIFRGRKVIVFSPTCSRADLLEKYDASTLLCHTWAEVLAHLGDGGSRRTVSIYPNGSLQHIE